MTISSTSKFVGVKVRGIDHWFWFKRSNISQNDTMFVAIEGWGESGVETDISVPIGLIEGEISSSSPQYCTP